MIALIDYGAGNTASVSNALKELNAEFILTNKEDEILAADNIILPGVGEASSAMLRLKELEIVHLLRNTKKPFLGICLGMQLLCSKTEEGNTVCLDIIPVNVLKLNSCDLKVPHMGWNQVNSLKDNRIFKSVDNNYFYFAHSYFVPQNEYTTSITNYGIDLSASVQYRNFYGVQFHPEKSAQQGLNIIKKFLQLC